MRGKDRTGLLAGAYLSRFLNATAKDVRDANHEVARRELNLRARNALEWIAWWREQEEEEL